MGPDRLSQALSLLGIAGYVYFLWFRPNQEGLALALGLALGGRRWPTGKALPRSPLRRALRGILFLQLFYGHPWAFLLGGFWAPGFPTPFTACGNPGGRGGGRGRAPR